VPRYNIQFDDALRAGIKTDSRVPRGALALDQCDYLRATEFGLKDFLPITQPIDNADLTPGEGTWTYPYPQLFRGAKTTLLCFADAVYEVNESTWTAAELSLYDAADFGDYVPGAGSITTGGPWHFVDYHDNWVLFNGITTIWMTSFYDRPLATDDVSISTGCDLKNRMFMGGFNPANFYALADWPTYWKTLLEDCPPELEQKYRTMATGADSNWAWWGTIGGGDLLWLVSKTLYTTGAMPASNMLSNGGFTGGATGWTGVPAGGWAYGTNAINGTAASGTVSQLSATMNASIRAGRSYDITFTMSNRTGGSVQVGLGAVMGSVKNTNATHTSTIIAAVDNAALNIVGNTFDGTVDTVILTETSTGTNQWSDESPWETIVGRNEFGMCPLPWQGTILCQKRLGETVICYGDGGITALVPYNAAVSGMAPLDIHGLGMGVGIASRCAVGGSYDEHVFVDNAGELWRLGTDLVATRIGYGHIFTDLLANQIYVNFDAHRREYYISGYNGTTYECYLWNSSGLSRAPFVPTSVHFLEGGLVGILQGSTAAGVEIITNRFGSQDPKAMDEVEGVALTTYDTDTTGWTVYVLYRFDKGATWSTSAGVVVDKRGYARINQTGLEFRIRLTHPDRTKADLDGITVEMQSGGKRSLDALAP
jgi:hypothetical protein